VLAHAELRALLPQRWPMLLLDRVDELEPGVRITAVKAVTGAEPCYQDLPDGLAAARYAYPFPLVLESFGQACAVLWRASTAAEPGDVLMFAAARDCVPRAAVHPGDVLRHEARLEHVMPGTAFACGSTWVGDREVATFGSLVAVARPAAQVGPLGSTHLDRAAGGVPSGECRAESRRGEMTPNRGEEHG
jgi:3-hydroxyacyl-[acyl-carrier-protein] dehydratase